MLRPVLLKSVPLTPAPGPLHAEYLALTEGLRETSGLGARGVWATTDSERLAEAFNGRSANRCEGLAELEARLVEERTRFEFVTLRWSRGSHRTVKFGAPSADSLARAALGLGKRK
jgi:ribonuclease HI